MSTQITKNTFEKFYDDTYKSVLKYTICHCNNLEDVNDIIQDIYTELYHKCRSICDRNRTKKIKSTLFFCFKEDYV